MLRRILVPLLILLLLLPAITQAQTDVTEDDLIRELNLRREGEPLQRDPVLDSIAQSMLPFIFDDCSYDFTRARILARERGYPGDVVVIYSCGRMRSLTEALGDFEEVGRNTFHAALFRGIGVALDLPNNRSAANRYLVVLGTAAPPVAVTAEPVEAATEAPESVIEEEAQPAVMNLVFPVEAFTIQFQTRAEKLWLFGLEFRWTGQEGTDHSFRLNDFPALADDLPLEAAPATTCIQFLPPRCSAGDDNSGLCRLCNHYPRCRHPFLAG